LLAALRTLRVPSTAGVISSILSFGSTITKGEAGGRRGVACIQINRGIWIGIWTYQYTCKFIYKHKSTYTYLSIYGICKNTVMWISNWSYIVKNIEGSLKQINGERSTILWRKRDCFS
jgi:hypothetical protein